MAAIRASGGAGAGGLRKVRDTEKRDRSAAMVPGGANESSAPTPSSGGGPQGGLAGALQDALAKRKQKVSGSGKLTCRVFTLCMLYHQLTVTQTMRKMTTMIGETRGDFCQFVKIRFLVLFAD